VEDCRVMYDCLYHQDGNFNADYGDMSVEDKLEIMESIVRITPMPIKRGKLGFFCNCCNAYQNYACEHSQTNELVLLRLLPSCASPSQGQTLSARLKVKNLICF
jgi:hypothetical protein